MHLSKQNFSILQLNTRSLNKNIDYLTMLLATLELSFSVIAVCETWAKDNSDIFLQIAGYNFVSIARSSREGGVGLYIRSDIYYLSRHDFCTSSTFESVFVETNNVKNRKGKFIVWCIYCPPGCELIQFNQDIESLLQNVTLEKAECLLVGILMLIY